MHPIILIRHGVGQHNLQSDDGCDTYSYDALLTPAGKRECEFHGYNIFKNICEYDEVCIYTSPLRRCLQTCYYMLKTAPKYMNYEQPKPLALLMEFDHKQSSCGHEEAYLRQHFYELDWSEMYTGISHTPWWEDTFRLNSRRVQKCMKLLKQKCFEAPVIAFTHGHFIYRATKFHVHNCEAVVSINGGKTWIKHHTIGKSPSRTNSRRQKQCT
tara:strand:+ start:65 stop:703 length:639 start_codon:yes stop_codon:yes gene_type:complete